MSDHLFSQIERYRAMSPAEQAMMDRLDGGELRRAVEIVERESGPRRKYNPYDTSEWVAGGANGVPEMRGWRTVDDNHFAAMREYYTRGMPDPRREEQRHVPPVHVLPAVQVYIPAPDKPMLMLEAGPQPFGELTQYASC